MHPFGDMHPYGDPSWYQGRLSPYFGESHAQLRAMVREMVDAVFTPNIHEWDEAGVIPPEIRQQAYLTGMAVLACGHPFPVDYGPPLPDFLRNVKLDIFHAVIVFQESCRAGSIGLGWGLGAGLCIGLPPVLTFGSEEMKRRVAPDVLAGKKIICLAVTEPTAGSDVARIKTSAVLSACKKFYIVNGEKKWITNGIWADYFTVAVRTEESGMKGISLLLLEKTMPGIVTRKMPCSGVWCSGTTYITLDNVKVPVENLIGKPNKGFKYIVHNFNYERIIICSQAIGSARCCYEEAWIHALRRKTFGKPLIEHQVIKWKLGEMARQIEACQAWLENLAFQIETMHPREADYKLGGTTALLKVQCTKVLEYCAREAAQIFGGLSFSRGGLGGKVERLSREVRSLAIPGGSEEIMIDLGVRMTTKVAQMAHQFLSAPDPTKGPLALARKAGVNMDIFGDGHPFCDPSWYLTFNSPFYNESHKRLRELVRFELVDKTAHDCTKLTANFFQSGLAYIVAAPKQAHVKCLNGVQVDPFHELILLDEVSRCGNAQVVKGLWESAHVAALLLGVPAHAGLGEKIVEGSVHAALCLYEESTYCDDFAVIQAKVSEGMLTGQKKFVSNAVHADFFVVLAKDHNEKLSLGVVDRKKGGVVVSADGTVAFDQAPFITLEVLSVNDSLHVLYERQRWALAVQAVRYSRIALLHSLTHAQEKEAFGKLLINHQGIRFKLGEMARQIEGSFAWVEQIAYNLTSKEEVTRNGDCALLKIHATKLLDFCIRESIQVLGTASLSDASVIPALNRNARFLSLLFGNEETLLDEGIDSARLYVKDMKKRTSQVSSI